jgi:hypothetical protein
MGRSKGTQAARLRQPERAARRMKMEERRDGVRARRCSLFEGVPALARCSGARSMWREGSVPVPRPDPEPQRHGVLTSIPRPRTVRRHATGADAASASATHERRSAAGSPTAPAAARHQRRAPAVAAGAGASRSAAPALLQGATQSAGTGPAPEAGSHSLSARHSTLCWQCAQDHVACSSRSRRRRWELTPACRVRPVRACITWPVRGGPRTLVY